MAEVWVPALLRDLTEGQAKVTALGDTVGEVVQNLERRFPGIEARLCDDGQLRPNISVVVDGTVSSKRLRHPLEDDSEVHFLPAISGG
jgi:molybdopterin converting factor small subunit